MQRQSVLWQKAKIMDICSWKWKFAYLSRFKKAQKSIWKVNISHGLGFNLIIIFPFGKLPINPKIKLIASLEQGLNICMCHISHLLILPVGNCLVDNIMMTIVWKWNKQISIYTIFHRREISLIYKKCDR